MGARQRACLSTNVRVSVFSRDGNEGWVQGCKPGNTARTQEAEVGGTGAGGREEEGAGAGLKFFFCFV